MSSIRAWPVALLAIVALPAMAQVERSGGKADVRVMQQLQQVTSERASLQAENGKLQQEIEQLKKDNAKLTAAKGTLEGRAKALEIAANRGDDSGKQAQEQLEKTRTQLQELVAKFRETAQALRDVEAERSAARSQAGARERDLNVCIDRNAGLYNLNAEVLDRMEHGGLWSSLAEREPFTKLKRVELENMADEYKFRANELRIEQQQAKSAR
ncbi:MAG: hypothetical protein ABW106_10535 [Steroidobacteraceae bacterium]